MSFQFTSKTMPLVLLKWYSICSCPATSNIKLKFMLLITTSVFFIGDRRERFRQVFPMVDLKLWNNGNPKNWLVPEIGYLPCPGVLMDFQTWYEPLVSQLTRPDRNVSADLWFVLWCWHKEISTISFAGGIQSCLFFLFKILFLGEEKILSRINQRIFVEISLNKIS